LTARDFFVGADGRPRWGWRLAIFAAAMVAALLLFGAVLGGLAAVVFRITEERVLGLAEWVGMLSLLAATAFVLRVVEKRDWSFVAMGREAARGWPIARGLLLGALAIGVPSGLLLATRWLRVDPSVAGSWGGAAWSLAVTLAPAALWEELMFRGYPFAVLRERFGWRAAVVATSVVFGLVHVANPGVSVEAIVMVVLAGVFLAAVLLVTESLYAAWAAHFAWNWTMAALMHVPVSGISIATPDYRLVEAGPDWATGGAWGPEGGVGALLGMTVGLWFLWSRPQGRALLSRVRGPADGKIETTNTDARPMGRGES
jgi:hypothetical protein